MFIILPEPTLAESVATLRREELKNNITASLVAATCVLGETTVDQQDSAAAFNVMVWKRHLLVLMTYSGMMLEKLELHYADTMERPWVVQQNISSVIDTLRDDPHQLMTMPKWAENYAVLKAMRSHLIYKDPAYGLLWPSLGPQPYPFPEDRGLRAFTD